MKPVLVSVIFICLFLHARSQTNAPEDTVYTVKVPHAVVKAFMKKYPAAKPDYWLQQEEDYEVQFVSAGAFASAEFNSKGKWINTETVVTEEKFPTAAQIYISKTYPGFEISSIIFQESPEGKVYIVSVADEENLMELVFDEKGEFLQPGELVD